MEQNFCPACSETPEAKTEGCNTPPVIEITNAEQPIAFHTVELEGTETDTPMVNGLYRNVIVKFLGNTHTWIYNSDGIPTYVAEEVNNGTLTLKVDGVTKGTFSANQSTDVEISLTDKILPLYHTTGQNTDGPIDQKVVTDELDTKVDKETGKGLSTNDYTTADKTKLDGIAAGAEVNVQPDYTQTDTTADDYIKNKPTIPSKTSDLTNDSGFQNSTEVGTAITTATTPINTAIDKTVMTDFSVSSNPSTTTITLDKAKQNILSGATSSSSTALPVASSSQAGVMNSATFDAVSTNTTNINAILNGTVAINGISASPTQAQLTTAWQTATGLTTVINGAKIYDQDNSKIWTYYTNQSQWLSTSASASVTVSQWTNSALGTIKGSAVDGQVFAENDGTGSVNGWDDLVNTVSGKEPSIATGTSSQYWRGDKTWQTLNSSAVGLGNVDNTSDATKKTNYTGSIASSNTGFVTGGDAYTALAAKANSSDIGNATLTIQKNGTSVGTFTANASTDATVNITTVTTATTESYSSSNPNKTLKDESGNTFYPQTSKDAIGGISHETWTFTLSDSTTVTKDVVLYS